MVNPAADLKLYLGKRRSVRRTPPSSSIHAGRRPDADRRRERLWNPVGRMGGDGPAGGDAVGESAALEWDDIDWRREEITSGARCRVTERSSRQKRQDENDQGVAGVAQGIA